MKLIFGASGHAKEIEWLIQDCFAAGGDDFRVDYFIVEGQSKITEHVGVPVLTECEVAQLSSPFSAFIAIGLPVVREKVYQKFSKPTVSWPSLVHPSVVYDVRDDRVRLGEGTIIFPRSTLTTNIRIGKHVHVNVGCSISHDALIGNFCTISPGVHLAGNVRLAERVFIGIGAVLLENVNVCADVIIGAGAVVLGDIVEPGTYVGIPAKQIK
jgi:sugar O-acyltransferase (sialic acid O-acetyltransferase NeuD family)